MDVRAEYHIVSVKWKMVDAFDALSPLTIISDVKEIRFT